MGKPLSSLVDQAEVLVQTARQNYPGAEIDVLVAWGGNEAVGGRTQSVHPELGNRHDDLVEKTTKCVDRLSALQRTAAELRWWGHVKLRASVFMTSTLTMIGA